MRRPPPETSKEIRQRNLKAAQSFIDVANSRSPFWRKKRIADGGLWGTVTGIITIAAVWAVLDQLWGLL